MNEDMEHLQLLISQKEGNQNDVASGERRTQPPLLPVE